MTSPNAWFIAPLDPSSHDRTGFDCGVEDLKRYLREQAAQDVRRRAAGCWVLLERNQSRNILGFYTLSPEAVELAELKSSRSEILKKLPRYPRLGAVLLGRLAVDRRQKGHGLGKMLLHDAMLRVLHAEIPAVLMVTDPKDGEAEAFYRKYGFERLNASRLFTTMRRISDTLGSPD